LNVSVFILFYINLPNVLRQHPVFVTETVKHMISVPCRCCGQSTGTSIAT